MSEKGNPEAHGANRSCSRPDGCESCNSRSFRSSSSSSLQPRGCCRPRLATAAAIFRTGKNIGFLTKRRKYLLRPKSPESAESVSGAVTPPGGGCGGELAARVRSEQSSPAAAAMAAARHGRLAPNRLCAKFKRNPKLALETNSLKQWPIL